MSGRIIVRRNVLPRSRDWIASDKKMTAISASHTGTQPASLKIWIITFVLGVIEEDMGHMQVDFANANIGGHALNAV